jgi:cation:H+ antiporter
VRQTFFGSQHVSAGADLDGAIVAGGLDEALDRPACLHLDLVRYRQGSATGLTITGPAVITVGGLLVERGARGLISTAGLPAALVGMVISPAVIESEEVVRQAVSAKMGSSDIAAGNLIGTVLYFTLFNLGLITLLTPVAVPGTVRTLDWPVLVGVSLLVAALLAHGRVTHVHGLLLLAVWAGYVAAHVWAG